VWDKALAYCRQAGEKATAHSAYQEAVGYFEQALSALSHLPETRDTREQSIDLRLALRTALQPSGDLGRSLACLREAEALAEALDDPHRLAQVSVFLSNYFFLMGAHDQAIASGQRALALATTRGDIVLQALANQRLGTAYQAQGDCHRAIACFRQTVASLDGERRYERFGQILLPAVQSRAWLGMCHAELGTFAEGRVSGEEGLRIAEAVGHRASLIFAYWGAGLPYLHQGDLPQALPLLERALGICQDADLSLVFPWVASSLGLVYTLSGWFADALPLLEKAVEQNATLGRWVHHALFVVTLGEAQMLAGRLEEARTLAERALGHARTYKERGNEAYALRLLGAIAAQRNPPESALAESHYRQARTLAEELGMRPLQAHCHSGLGTLYAATGQREQARPALSAAIALYRAMEMTFWLPQTEAALAQVEGR
jgi:tetratricopeptide (TPR) repeat protein